MDQNIRALMKTGDRWQKLAKQTDDPPFGRAIGRLNVK